MKYYKRVLGLLLPALVLLGMTGCGTTAPEASAGSQGAEEVKAQNKYANVESMEEAPIVKYKVPHSTPNILVGLRGYSVDEKKEAYVKGRELPERFQIVKVTDGEVVYTGVIQDIAKEKEQDLYSGYIEFTDFETVGEYYIQCDIVGRSLSFVIQEDLYASLLEEVYSKTMERCADRELTISEALLVLQTYEWYAEVFPDADGDGRPDVLTALQKWISYREESGVEKEQEALYAAFLAKFSYHYRKIDHKYATDALQRASTVYGQIQEGQTKDADIFYALTELYRATDHYKYRNAILTYDTFFRTNGNFPEQAEYIYGGLTYSMTRHAVSNELCAFFIDCVLAGGEEISKEYKELIHPIAAKNDGVEEVLKRAMELSCANYVLNNYQYTNIMKEFLWYLTGRNVESVDFYGAGERVTEYLPLLAQLVATKTAVEE